MSVRYYQNNNNSSLIILYHHPENKNDIFKTKITILFLIGIFSIIFGCLPIFFDRILYVKEFFLRIFKIFKKSKKYKTNNNSNNNNNDDDNMTRRIGGPSTSLTNVPQITSNQYFDNNKIKTTTKTSTAIVNQKLKTHKNFHQLIKFLLCFGGGVLFFTSFIHLHPEIREIFKNLEKRKIFTNTINGLGGIQTSELLICCGFFLIYILEELMHYLIAIREMKNNSELILHRALTKCNQVIFWKRNNNNHHHNHYHNHNLDDYNNDQRMNTLKNRKNEERHDFLDSYECHFGFDPEIITMDEFSNNYRRDSLPMECPLSSISSSNYGDQQQSTVNSYAMSYIHLQHGIQEYGLSHPLSESSATLLMETSSGSPPVIPPHPSPPQIDFENIYVPNNLRNYNDDNVLKNNRAAKSVTFSMDQNPKESSTAYLKNNMKIKTSENNKILNIPFQFNSSNNDDNTSSNLQTILRGLVAIFALSIHSLFEGLAVGLEKNISNMWYLFLAIGTHKFVIIFCIGIELVASKLKTLWITIYIIGFAMVTPLGILIGALISHSYDSTNKSEIFNNSEITSEGILLTVAAMLQAVAAGTLLYVIFFEILVKERHHHHHFGTVNKNNIKSNNNNDVLGYYHHSAESLIQCFAVGCGFMFMIGVQSLLSKHSHGHIH